MCALDRVDQRGELRHADARDHARGADRARSDADLHRVGAGIDQSLRAVAGGDVARHHLAVVGEPLYRVDCGEHTLGMAMGGVDHDHVDAGIEQRLGAFQSVIADAGSRRDAQAAILVLAGVGEGLGLFHVLDGDEADAAIGIVDHQQLLDPVLVQEPPRFVTADAGLGRDQLVLGHQAGDLLVHLGRKAHVAVGQDADQLAVAALHYRNARDLVPLHEVQRVCEGFVGMDGERVHHHAAFEALHLAHLFGLADDIEVLVDDAHAAVLSHGDGHAGLRHRVHGGGHQRDVEADALGELGPGVGLGRKHR